MHTDRSNPFKWLRRLAIAAVATTAVVAAPAWSAVTDWSFSVTTTFADPATGTNGAIHPQAYNGHSNTLLCWGTPAGGGAGHAPCPGSIGPNQSALKIDPSAATGTLHTVIGSQDVQLIDLQPATTLTHYNNPLNANSNSLTRATLLNSVQLQALLPPGSQEDPWAANFSINFTETSNSGTCAAPPQSNPCSDIFVLGGNALNQSFVYPDDGETYWLHFFAMGADGNVLPSLTNAECAAAGASSGCFGFVTQEGQATPMRLGIAISTVPFGVPEPGALGMMGLGVLGIGLAFGLNRRRRNLRAE